MSVHVPAHDVSLPGHCIVGGRPHWPSMHLYWLPQSESLAQGFESAVWLRHARSTKTAATMTTSDERGRAAWRIQEK